MRPHKHCNITNKKDLNLLTKLGPTNGITVYSLIREKVIGIVALIQQKIG